MSEVKLRRPAYDDIDALARVHVASWQAGYRDLMPAEFLAAQDPAVRARQRRESWHDPAYAHVRGYVAERDGELVGFVHYGPERRGHGRGWADVDPDGGGEVYALYVHPDHWGCGAAAELFTAAVTELLREGLTPVRVWTLEGNERALRFYRRHGFVADGARQPITLGATEKLTLPELRLTLAG